MKSLNKININYPRLLISLLFLYLGTVYFSFAISNILVGVLVFVFVLGLINKQITVDFSKKKKLYYLLIITPFILTLFSVLLSDNLAKAIEYIWLRYPMPIIPFIALAVIDKRKDLLDGMLVFILLSLLATLVSLYNAVDIYIDNGTILNPDFTKDITLIQHPYFGVYQLVALVLVVKLDPLKSKNLRKLVIAFLVIGIILSTSRIVYLLFLGLLIFEIIANFSTLKRLLLIGVLLISFISLTNLNEKIHNKVYNTFEYWKSPRMWLWHNSYKVIINADNPVLGIGIGDYYEKTLPPKVFKHTEKGTWGYNPHNQYLEFVITNGVFSVFFVLSMGYLLYFIRKKDKASIYIFVIIASFAFTESIFNRLFGIELYSVFIPVILSIKIEEDV